MQTRDAAGYVSETEKSNKQTHQKECHYYIVEFEDGLQIIQKNWLINDKVALWPPFKDWKKYYNAVKNMDEPLPNWTEVCIIKIIDSANTFPRAMEKLSIAEYTSDISTESDVNIAKSKRRKHARKIQSDNEEESSGHDDNFTNTYIPLPMPPQVKYSNKKHSAAGSQKSITGKIILSDSNRIDQHSSESENEVMSRIIQPVQNNRLKNINVCARSKQANISDFQKSTTGKIILSDSYRNDQRNSESENEIMSPIMQSVQNNRQENINVYARSKQDTVSKTHCNLCKVTQNLQQDAIKLTVENNLRLKKCEKMLKDITEVILNKKSATTSIFDINVDTDLHPEYFPAQSLADFHAAEEKLKINIDYKHNIVKFFVQCKGSDIKNSIYTIMAKLMSNNVAMQYSWTGAKQNKEKFEESPFLKIAQTIILQLHKDATLYIIKKCITDWLRHAKERHIRHSRGNQNQESAE